MKTGVENEVGLVMERRSGRKVATIEVGTVIDLVTSAALMSESDAVRKAVLYIGKLRTSDIVGTQEVAGCGKAKKAKRADC